MTLQTAWIFIGGMGESGKTIFIQQVSEIGVVSTESKYPMDSEGDINIAFDFGRVIIEENKRHLYFFGHPGNYSIDNFRKKTFRGVPLESHCIGVIVMVDSTRMHPIEEVNTAKLRREGYIYDYKHSVDAAFKWVAEIREYKKLGVPYLFVANKQDREDADTIEYLRERLQLQEDEEMVPCVATNRESVKSVLLKLLDMGKPDEAKEQIAERIRGL